jgi:hypothetical protein
MNIVSSDLTSDFIPGSEPGFYNLKETILYFYYSAIRTNNIEHQLLQNLLLYLFTNRANPQYLICLYCLIGFIHDTSNKTLTYPMIYIWSIYDLHLGSFALKYCVNLYGNCKDIKGICQYVKDTNEFYTNEFYTNELIQYAIKLLNEKIHEDTQIIELKTQISEAAKCAPRQMAKRHGWIFNLLANHYYINYSNEKNKSEKNVFEYKHSIKAKTEYRKIITKLTQKYDEQILITPTIINPYIPKVFEINNIDSTNIEDKWNLLMEIVDSPRYEILKTKITDYLHHQ